MARRGENIYKRKDGRWEGRYIKGQDIFGKAKYGYVYAKTYMEVKEKLNEIKTQPLNVNINPENAKTVEQMCFIWLDEIKSQLKSSSYVKYYNIVNNHIIPSIGKYKIQFLDTATIRRFTDEKLTHGRIDGTGGLSPKTVKDYLSVIKLIIDYASNIGVCCNVNFDLINIKSCDNSIEVLSATQRKALSNYLINNINNTNLGILICLYTGLRIGEICALKFGDISATDRVVHIRKTMQRIQNVNFDSEKKTKIVITSPKSKSSIRDIPIPEFIMRIIEQNFYYTSKEYLLSGDTLHYIEPRTLENRFKTIIKKCGITDVKFHILRHTFATYSVELGFETKSLSEILGHSSVNITLNRYVHSSMELKRINMEKLNFSPSIS